MPVSNYANAFETTLTAGPGPTGLVFNVVSTTGAPDSPCWLVVNPYNSSKREYIYFDGTFTGTTFVTSTIDNRYGDGSAAPSGITHEQGAVVLGALVKQHLDELVAEIDAKAGTSHDHDPSGATSIASDYVARQNGELKNYSENWEGLWALPSSYNVDVSIAQHWNLLLQNTPTTLTFSGWPAGRLSTLTLRLKQDGTGNRTVNWPAGIHWPGKVAPTLTPTADAVDILMIRSFDGGTTIEGFLIGPNMGTV